MSEFTSPVGKYLGKIAGTYDGAIPEPANDLEKGLKDIAEKEPSPSSGGVNVLELYSNAPGKDEDSVNLYLDAELTEQCATYDEAVALIQDADIIKIHITNNNNVYFGTNIVASPNGYVETVFIYTIDKFLDGLLWSEFWA